MNPFFTVPQLAVLLARLFVVLLLGCEAGLEPAQQIDKRAEGAEASISVDTDNPFSDSSLYGRDGVGSASAFDAPPDWAKEAIWYQIFVERFRNGDPDNDPQLIDVQPGHPDTYPQSWSVSDWNQDWYAAEDWMADIEPPPGASPASFDRFERGVQMRRFGGDLQGVLESVDYLKELGINAVYFNPLNDAPSLHKYDARYYHHIDRTFGPDPEGDRQLMAEEKHADPNSWSWSAADRLFLKVIDSLHRSGIRLIMDYSWNHTGADFWALHDLREQGPESEYADWYQVESWDDPATEEDEFAYEGWFGIETLPVLAEDNEPLPGYDFQAGDIHPELGGFRSSSLREHIFAVSRRWLDPNGDGDPSDGVDGFRLDVAAEVGMDFWRAYRRQVRAINPEAYLVGEVWWQRWPDRLMDPAPYLQGDIFDAVMDYRWYKLARGAVARLPPKVDPADFLGYHDSLQLGIDRPFMQAMMSMSASHDSPRLATSLANEVPYKAGGDPKSPDYNTNRPAQSNWALRQLPLLVQQFSWTGAPQIYYGDEVGLFGADDPACRKPMLWPDSGPRIERTDADGTPLPVADRLTWDDLYVQERLSAYRKLTYLRKSNPCLVYGRVETVDWVSSGKLIAYRRVWEDEELVCIFHPLKGRVELAIPPGYELILSKADFGLPASTTEELTKLVCNTGDFYILRKN